MAFMFDPSFHMTIVFLLTIFSIVSFVREKISIEAICVIIITTLLLLGQFFPLLDAQGKNQLSVTALLSGFSNPALVTVLALLVMGKGVIQTDALRGISSFLMRRKTKHIWVLFVPILIFVMVFSAFMNNTPLVVLAIPIVQALVHKANLSEGKFLMPLSFVAILGGMTTLVGSSTNLLVSSTLEDLGYEPFTFFQFFVPGVIMAAIGLVYVLLVVPHLLRDRKKMLDDLIEDREFIAEIEVKAESPLVGELCVEGVFPSFPEMNIKMIQRGWNIVLPPFEGYSLETGDIVLVSATRDALTGLLSRFPGYLLSDDQGDVLSKKDNIAEGEEGRSADIETRVENAHILAEIMIPPGSRYIDMTVEQAGFRYVFRTIVLGIQRRAKVVRRRLSRVRLQQGDVLLIAGSRKDIYSMREHSDVVVLSGSKEEIPLTTKAPIAMGVFLGVIGLAASGVLSIPVASIVGAVLMIATNCLNIRQATRALDRKIFFLVGSMLALGIGLDASGGALVIAGKILSLPFADDPLVMVGLLFGVVAIATNILSNNACAILFTPIAVNLAANLGVDPMVFATTVVFAANCSFASPIGYQTNLLVMGPGHYQFSDFMRAGIPLIGILWIVYIFIAKYYYGIG